MTYCVYRQDDNGQIFEIRHGIDREAAESLRDELERRGHKQVYWIQQSTGCVRARERHSRLVD